MAPRTAQILQGLTVAVAVLFGAATILAGVRVLRGVDPGYQVFRPLLVFNTGMGAAYLGVGVALWRRTNAGRYAAGAIFLLNLLVLAVIGMIYRRGGAIAAESLQAMTLRTAVWLALFLSASWLVGSRSIGRG